MPQGTIKDFVGTTGHIECADYPRPVFFHRSALPETGTVKVGDPVEFEVAMGPKGLRAEKIRPTIPGSPSPPQAPTPTAAAVPAAATGPTPARALGTKLAVSIRTEEIIVSGNLWCLPVKVLVRNDQGPLGGVPVTLKYQIGKQEAVDVLYPHRKPSTSGDKGEATFTVWLEPNTTMCTLIATVEKQNYSELWRKDTPSAVTIVTAVPSGIQVEKRGPDTNGVYTFLITTAPDAEVTFGGNVAAEARLVGHTTWSQSPFTADHQGRVELEVQVKDTGAKGEIYFRSAGLQSKPRYVTSKK